MLQFSGPYLLVDRFKEMPIGRNHYYVQSDIDATDQCDEKKTEINARSTNARHRKNGVLWTNM